MSADFNDGLDAYKKGNYASALAEKLTKPIIVGHSLGGMCSVVAASQFKDELYGLVIVDTAIMPPSEIPDKFDFKIKANKTYKSIEDAKLRFRLVPSQEFLRLKHYGINIIMVRIQKSHLIQMR